VAKLPDEGIYRGEVKYQTVGRTDNGKPYVELSFRVGEVEGYDGEFTALDEPFRQTWTGWLTTAPAITSTAKQLARVAGRRIDPRQLDPDREGYLDLTGKLGVLRIQHETYKDREQAKAFLTDLRPKLAAADKEDIFAGIESVWNAAMAEAVVEEDGAGEAPAPAKKGRKKVKPAEPEGVPAGPGPDAEGPIPF
jgi:hypothetical protein